MFTWALCVEYRGLNYSGWQVQADPAVPTVQDFLQKALSFVADEPIKVVCAGRTDAGVSAVGQVVSFKTNAVRPSKAWVQGVNTRLPSDISVAWASEVPENFHARFSALSRRYQYLILNRSSRSAMARGLFTHYGRKLDAGLMHEAVQCLVGEHDFTSFRGAGCQGNTPNRNVMDVSVTRDSDVIAVEIEANAFLLHMVRNIVGSLLDVGAGLQPPTWLADLLTLRDRTKAGVTAPPDGLYLVEVKYPQSFSIPKPYRLPSF